MLREKMARFVIRAMWLAAIGYAISLIYQSVFSVTGTPLLAAPVAALFGILALIAGRPYAVRPPGTRTVRRLRVRPKDERTSLWTRLMPLRLAKLVLPKRRFVLLRTLALTGACAIGAGAAAIPFVHAKITESLPKDLSMILEYNPSVTTRVYSRDKELVCTFTNENRVIVPLSQVPMHVRQAFIAAEDKHFLEHSGIDPEGIVRAAIANYKGGETRQGASTLTQQVTKLVVLQNSERTYRRKIQELILAVDIERRMSKEDILSVYLNQVFLGHNAYGVQAAAMAYFSKDVSELTLAEAALIAGLPQAPSNYSPYGHFDQARQRQAYVLGRMVEDGYITAEQSAQAWREDLPIIFKEDALNRTAAPYFCDRVRRELKQMYGNETVFDHGLTVQTTLDMRMQRAAESSVRRGLIDLERRIGWGGPEGKDASYRGCAAPAEDVEDGTIDVARVARLGDTLAVCLHGNVFPVHPEDAKRIADWSKEANASLTVGDLMSVQIITVKPTPPPSKPGAKAAKAAAKQPEAEAPKSVRYAITARRTSGPDHPEALQAALVAADPHTGELRAYVGGYDFTESQYDAASMAHRQPGSSIKPYVYLTALMRGMEVDDSVYDAQFCYPTASGVWCPQNYRGPHTVTQYWGKTNLRWALAQSLNSVSVQLAHKSGIENVIRTMRALGITSPLKRVLPLAVGSTELTLWEHTFAYAAIAAGGKKLPRHPGAEDIGVFITSVTDARGRDLYRYEPKPRDTWEQAVPADSAYAMTYLMRGVVEQGTGKRVRELQRPAAAKTGTTNDFRDTWFMGFTNDLAVGVWVGRLTPHPIVKEATGGSVALPIWLAAVKEMHPNTPAREFEIPADVQIVHNPWSPDLIPYQRGRLPGRLLLGNGSAGIFAENSPFK